MPDRFKRLYELPSNLYSDKSPVIVSADALLMDTQTGSIIVQLKFKNISSLIIKALCVDIVAFDISGNIIPGKKNYQYLDLYVQNGLFFGSNKAIVMPDETTRSFSIEKLSVVLLDGNIYEVSLPMSQLPNGTLLQDKLSDAELIKQYQLKTTESAKYVPFLLFDLWQCPCGEWNKAHKCAHCNTPKDLVFSAYELDSLSKDMTERLITEQAIRKEAAEQKALENERKRIQNKKFKKITLILTICLTTVLILCLWVYPNVIVPGKAYREADQLFHEEKYADAVIAFQVLGDFRDSRSRLEEAKNCMMDEVYKYGIQLMEEEKYADAIQQFQSIDSYKDSFQKIEESICCMLDIKYKKAKQLYEEGLYREAIEIFQEVVDYRDTVSTYTESLSIVEAAKEDILKSQYAIAEELFKAKDYAASAMAFAGLGNYNDAKERSFEIWGLVTQRDTISANISNSIAVQSDGTVIATGENGYGECRVSSWKDIVSISMGRKHTVGLKSDGSVIAVSSDYHLDNRLAVDDWSNIVSVSAGWAHTVGLKNDGTVIAVGENWQSQCEVDSWTDIVAISAGGSHTVGLKSDGTVVATDMNPFSQENHGQCDVSEWKDIIKVYAGYDCTIGIKSDGTVIATGVVLGEKNLSKWTDIVAVCTQGALTIGLKSDGTVVQVGSTVYDYGHDISSWKDIVAICTGNHHTLGLKSNGSVISTGDNSQGQCNISKWNSIRLPTKNIS